ncbi:response regulator [Halosolutus gelatinilyticus]|uniref:response regulator n=1 Tax=Halosolutus gelatinilyticus TaxID=2931975 RepID=UPI001FF49209|nr:response regulator [Halosolutus gelatinilyticus]
MTGATADPRTGRRTVRILHVDDDPNFAALTAVFLERKNDRFTVKTARSASEGFEQIVGGDFDCVVSDYEMPGRNGLEFLQAVREENPDLPFILFTGKGSEAVASDAAARGVTDYFRKGVGTEQYDAIAERIDTVVAIR